MNENPPTKGNIRAFIALIIAVTAPMFIMMVL